VEFHTDMKTGWWWYMMLSAMIIVKTECAYKRWRHNGGVDDVHRGGYDRCCLLAEGIVLFATQLVSNIYGVNSREITLVYSSFIVPINDRWRQFTTASSKFISSSFVPYTKSAAFHALVPGLGVEVWNYFDHALDPHKSNYLNVIGSNSSWI